MISEVEKRAHRACFTGHRPEKLNQSETEIKAELESKIKKAMENGIDVFISGMARGVDIWAAEIVLKLRSEGCPVRLICASPYDGFERSWSPKWQQRYRAIMNSADVVRYICPGFNRGCFQIRNKWMVDHSALVIAVFNGEKGGTKNTIDYAMKKNVIIDYLNAGI